MSISWGKLLGGVAAVTGIAVAGVGLGGASIASALGSEGTMGAIGDFFGKAGTAIAENAESAAKYLNISDATIESLGGGKGIAAIVGGVAAIGGGAALAFSGNSAPATTAATEQDEQLLQLAKLLPPEAKAQLIQALQIAMSESAPPIPGGKGRTV